MKVLKKPRNWEIIKLLLWKNWKIYCGQKCQCVLEILSPLSVGILLLVMRSLLPATGVTPARYYPSFSPDYLPPGQVPDVDDLLNTSRIINRRTPIADGLCDLIRTSLHQPDRLSVRSLISGLQKVDQLEPQQIDFMRPEFLAWLAALDLVALLHHASQSVANEDVREILSLLQSLQSDDNELIAELLVNFLQTRRTDIVTKVREFKKFTSSVDFKAKRWLVFWSPPNPVLSSIMRTAAINTPFIGCSLDNSSLVLEALTKPLPFSQEAFVLAAVNFPDNIRKNTSSLPHHLPITIRFPGLSRFKFDEFTKQTVDATKSTQRTNWDTSYSFPKISTPGARNGEEVTGGSPGYWREGFLGLQSSISAAIASYYNRTVGGTIPPINVRLQRFPEPSAFEDPQSAVISLFVSGCFHFGLAFLVMATVRKITAEKESHFNEALKIVGVKNWQHWVAWFFPTALAFLLASAVATLTLKFPFADLAFLRNADIFCFFLVHCAYALSIIALCFFMTIFFSTASGAVTGSACIWVTLLLFVAFLDARELEVSYNQRLWTSLLPTAAMGYIMKTVIALEGVNSGLNWSTLYYQIPDTQNVPVGILVEMLLVEAVVLLVATLYLELILPGCSGIPLPWYFPFTKKYWFGSKPAPFVEVANNDESQVMEAEPVGLVAGVEMKNLRKVYCGKAAVAGLSMNLYQGKITVLLGHNGAGKTTTMSMLTGMTAPTCGIAKISGVDVVHDPTKARSFIGYCPQGNILLDNLTVSDHLWLMCALKGLEGEELNAEVSKYTKMLLLDLKSDTLSKNLSGGMKRKLSVALAFCGNSKVVLLDEPTSGMDPASRRALWELIQKEKSGRTILLSTHFMDEADLLGDRIAIMSGGKLRAAGTSFFLKKNFGGGYRVILIKGSDCSVGAVTDFFQKFFPGLYPTSDIGAEVSYVLPDHYSPGFPTAFLALENEKKALNILGYGVATASIEDVFMNVLTEKKRKISLYPDVAEESADYTNTDTYVSLGMEPLLTGLPLWLSQISGLVSKLNLLRVRSFRSQLFGLIGPTLIAIAAINMARSWQGTNDLPAREFTFKDFSQGMFAIFRNSGGPLVDTISRLAVSEGASVADLTSFNSPDEAVINYFMQHPVSARTNLAAGISYERGKTTALFNNNAFHTAPLALQLIYNGYLQTYVNESIKLSFSNHPLPYSGIMKAVIQQKGMNVSYNLSYHTALAFTILTAWIVVSRVRERATGSLHQQLMAGVHPFLLWNVTYIMDLLYSVASCCVFVYAVYLYQEDGLSTIQDIGKLLLICVTHHAVSLPIAYMFTFFFSSQGQAFMTISVVNYMCGPLSFVFWTTIRFHNVLTKVVFDRWQEFLAWVPSYSVAFSILNMNQLHWVNGFCKPVFEKYCNGEKAINPCCREPEQCPPEGCIYWTEDFFDEKYPGFGTPMRACLILGVIVLLIIHLYEAGYFSVFRLDFGYAMRESLVKSTDSDVAKECKLVRQVDPNKRRDINLLVRDLTKNYDEFEAVKKISLIVPAGECFGLLGVNGAGKTTAFRMLTGDLEPSAGDAFVHGHSITNDRKQVHKLIGYCPQFDAHLEELTGRETLRIFCQLRGVPHAEVELTCEKLARELLFYAHIDQKVEEYSGGNKRKLSVAVALVGDPPVLFLDEPTSGMDPVAKRFFWQVISKLRSTGKTIILTSHSMEECEALCTRVGIMVQGELFCLGSPQYLKTKFTQGYCLTVKTRQDSGTAHRRRGCANEPRSIHEYICKKLPGAVVKGDHDSVITFHIPAGSPLVWADMFSVLEAARVEKRIADYYLGQSGLEEVFLRFASDDRKKV